MRVEHLQETSEGVVSGLVSVCYFLFTPCLPFSTLCFRLIWTAAAQFCGGPASLGCVGPRTYPRHRPDVALQPDHAHAARVTPHPALLPGGYCGPDGVVQRELARRGENNRGVALVDV